MKTTQFDEIRYSTQTHTVPFTSSGMNGKWSPYRKNKVAAAERQQAAVAEARQAGRPPSRKESGSE